MKFNKCHPVILPSNSGIHRLRVAWRDKCFQADGDLYNDRLS